MITDDSRTHDVSHQHRRAAKLGSNIVGKRAPPGHGPEALVQKDQRRTLAVTPSTARINW